MAIARAGYGIARGRGDVVSAACGRAGQFSNQAVLARAFRFYSAIILFVVHPVVGAIAFALAFLVFWSRLYLGRHDLLETLVGASLGLLGGLVTAS